MANDKKLVKCRLLGKGSYGTVNMAAPQPSHTNYSTTSTASQLVAVKSVPYRENDMRCLSLKLEGHILSELQGCPEIITCFGDDFSIENGTEFYNLLLEFAPEGTLTSLIEARGGRLPEWEVRWYAYKLLKGLFHIHEEGYVHCDVKPSNILVFPSPRSGINYLKIADFGLAKERGDDNPKVVTGSCFRGTPLYSSPESVLSGKYEAPMDIWALGCSIIEMVAGKPIWSATNIEDLRHQITSEEVPDMPAQMSEEGKDFLRSCLDRNPAKRWTAEMLLRHPFVTIGDFATIDEGRNLLVYESPLGFGWVSSLSLFSISC
ncbi:hypothetical protein LguiB_006502 [Lonicera macranthoides]